MNESTYNKTLLIFKGILIGLIATLLLVIGFGFGSGELNFNILKGEVAKDTSCEGKPLQDALECLRSDFNEWFVYNLNNTGIPLTEEELKEQGGVCSHASKWYIQKAEDLGFYGRYITFYGDHEGHAIALIYDKDINSYCIVDQWYIHCQEMEL